MINTSVVPCPRFKRAWEGILWNFTRVFVAFSFISTLTARAADNSPVLSQWIQAQSSIQTFEADFKQTRQLKALTQPLTSTGKIWFAAPDRFRWEVMKPAPTIAVREKDELLIIFPKLKRADRYSLAKLRTGPWKDLMGLLDTGFPRSEAEFEERFHVENTTPISGGYRLEIEPKSALVKKYMPNLAIDITSQMALLGTTMQFVDGSVLKNEFSNQVMNGTVDSSLFEPKIPGDYTVTEPLAGGTP